MHKITEACARLKEAKIRTSLFVDANEKQIDAAAESLVPCIEIHTGHYANAIDDDKKILELNKIIKSVAYASNLGLKVHAGHGLSYTNVIAIAAIPELLELNIGHSIIARAVLTGLSKAIREMKRIIASSVSQKY